MSGPCASCGKMRCEGECYFEEPQMSDPLMGVSKHLPEGANVSIGLTDPFIDASKEGFFHYHSCYKCNDGEKPCVTRSGVCQYPHARND